MNDYVLNINGKNVHVTAAEEESLLSVLRNRLNLTGTKYGCGEAQCGACTVLLNGTATRSCVTTASSVEGVKITTIEGLEENGRLSAVQQAFVEEGAYQCGYCTSGMVLCVTALLQQLPSPTEKQIIAHMNGNICRCGTYPRIVSAIQRAAKIHAAEDTSHSVASGGAQ